MGTVYLGADTNGQLAALKVLHPHLAMDTNFVERFRREASLATQVDSRFTARVIAADFEAEVPYLATEYVPAPTLAEHVERSRALESELLTPLAVGLAEALRSIHSLGIVHRDLTPRNVLIAEQGPKVVDFGIARGAGQASMTGTGTTMGTPGWVAPEVLRGEDATPASDMFALGALLTYAASGQNPFGEGASDAILYRVMHEEPSSPASLREPLDALVAACLKKRAADRPTAGEALAMLVEGDSTQPLDLSAQATQLLDQRDWHVPDDAETLSLDTLAAAGEPARKRPRWSYAAASLGVMVLLAGAVWATTPLDLPATGLGGSADPDLEQEADDQQPPTEQDEPGEGADPGPLTGDGPVSSAPPTTGNPSEPPSPTPPASDDGSPGDPPQRVYTAVAERGFEVRDTSFWQPEFDLRAVTAHFEGSATGRGMHVFFFVEGRGLIGTDTSVASETVALSWRTADIIAVEYTLYREDDPGCCPTGGTATVRYQWDGQSLSPLDEIPPLDGFLSR